MITYTVEVYSDGTEKWFKNSKLHRENGPAIVYPYGPEEYYHFGKLHRENGPAIIYPDGTEAYFQNGKRLSKEEVMNPKHTISIDGKTIEISHESFIALKETLK